MSVWGGRERARTHGREKRKREREKKGRERKRAHTRERESMRKRFGSSFYMFFLDLGLPYANRA